MPRPSDCLLHSGTGSRPTAPLTRLLCGLTIVLAAWTANPLFAAEPVGGSGSELADKPLIFDTNLGLIQRATEEAIERGLEGMKLPPGSEIQLFPVLKLDGDWFVEDRIASYLSNKGYKVYLIEKPKAAAVVTPEEGDLDGDGVISMTEAGRLSGGVGQAAATNSDSSATAGGPASPGDSAGAVPTSPPTPAERNGAPMPATTPAGPTGKNPNVNPVPPSSLTPVLNEFPEDIEGLVLSFRVVEFGVTYHDQWRQGFLGQRVVERFAAVDLNFRLVSGDAKNIIWVGNGRSERLDIVPKSKLDLLEGRAYPFIKPSLPPQSLSRLVEPVLVLGIVAGLVFLFYSNQN